MFQEDSVEINITCSKMKDLNSKGFAHFDCNEIKLIKAGKSEISDGKEEDKNGELQ